ncbi:MAG TPA: DUF1353 domain-containing protein [Acidimicrobiia bacterium]|nr:DUF1353 domain-containing protein [Acidimicrobiia bacterium]
MTTPYRQPEVCAILNPMPFYGEVVVKPVPPEGIDWKLVEPFAYEGNIECFMVPKDFTTDFASVPRLVVWLLPRYGRWTQAAVLHDYLSDLARQGKFDRFDADGIFNRALRELDVPFLRRWIMWAGVRWAAGPGSWFKRGAVPFLKMVAISVPTLAVIIVPALVVLAALVVGVVSESLVYLPLRLFHRDKTKTVNAPDPKEVLFS